MEAYYALPLQVACEAVNNALNREEATLIMERTIDRISKQISTSKRFIGEDCRLVVLPEYFLTSFPMGESIEEWANKACVDMDGKEYDALGAIAQSYDIYLSGNVYEKDPNFPGSYFQTSFIIDPSGDVAVCFGEMMGPISPLLHSG